MSGPTRISFDYDSCGLCDHLYRRMIHSGRDPLNYYYCQHTDICADFEKREFGRFIGKSDETPPWCPLAQAGKG